MLLAWISCCALAAQRPASEPPPEPPEEDVALAPREYTLNPVQSKKEITAGNFYFKKGNYRAAATRYREATRWDNGSAEAFFKLGEANEKARDLKAAREAYETYLKLEGDAKIAAALRKKIAKWPK